KVKDIVRKARGVIVMDRAFSYGSGGILAQEVKSACYGLDVPVYSVVGGLGGKDVRPVHIEKVIEEAHANGLEDERWLI
ncbi:MAG: pyruvate ferredoxin oxidoreductase, partial [Metallosphaera sp.]